MADSVCADCGIALGALDGARCKRCRDELRYDADDAREYVERRVGELLDPFDQLAHSYGYLPAAPPPTQFYMHPTLLCDIEVHRAARLEEQWWHWRPAGDVLPGSTLSLPWEQRPHSGMSVDGLRAILERVHGQQKEENAHGDGI